MFTVLKSWCRSLSSLVSSHIPTKKQYGNWSLPSKLTALGFLFGVIGVFCGVLPLFKDDGSTDRIDQISKDTREIKTSLDQKKNFGLTEEQYKKFLEEMFRTFTEELKVVTGDEKGRRLLEKKLNVVQGQLFDFQKSYEKELERRNAADRALVDLKGQLPYVRIEEARKSLEQGDTEKAEKIFDEVVDKESGAVALAAYQSGELAIGRLDFAKALRQFKKAAALEEDNPKYLAVAGGIAIIFSEYSQAQYWLERLLIFKDVERMEGVDLVEAQSLLAFLYMVQGRDEEAESLIKSSMEISEKSQSKYHPSFVAALISQALLYESQGQYNEAQSLLKRSLKVSEKISGNLGYNISATSLFLQANLYKHQGQDDEAELLYKRRANA